MFPYIVVRLSARESLELRRWAYGYGTKLTPSERAEMLRRLDNAEARRRNRGGKKPLSNWRQR